MDATVGWDTQTVIGKKTKQPKVAKNESDVNGIIIAIRIAFAFTNILLSRSYASI
jgi:hypothetical protein